MPLGMEVEIRLGVTTPDGKKITKGDTLFLEHDYFKLVTDKFSGYSNLEFVMKHFDQLSPTLGDSLKMLQERLRAMHTLSDGLYAGAEKKEDLGDAVTALSDPDQYVLEPEIKYTDTDGKTEVKFHAADAKLKVHDDVDDNKLLIHYTIGFEPASWFKVVQDVTSVTRGDSDADHDPKKYAENAIQCANSIASKLQLNRLNDGQKQELLGHLALLYMQMMVFVVRTASLQVEILQKEQTEKGEELNGKKLEIRKLRKEKAEIAAKIEELENENQDTKDAKRDLKVTIRKIKNLLREAQAIQAELTQLDEKVENASDAAEFGKGQPKNQIALLSRASLAKAFSILSKPVQDLLTAKANQKIVIDALADDLEKNYGLDFNEGLILQSSATSKEIPGKKEASLIGYVKGGLGSQEELSQQIVFGGMNEVGIDTSISGKNLLPMELRLIFGYRVTWDELNRDAEKLLRWSRDPQTKTLA